MMIWLSRTNIKLSPSLSSSSCLLRREDIIYRTRSEKWIAELEEKGIQWMNLICGEKWNGWGVDVSVGDGGPKG